MEINEFSDVDFFQNLKKSLVKFKETTEHSDIILKVNDHEFPAHKIMLSASSPYFEVMFSGRFPESNQKIVELHGLETNAVKSILNYLYTGSLSPSFESAPDILKVADFFQLEWVKSQCCGFLRSGITSHNCIALWRLAELYSIEDLLIDAEKHAIHNIVEVSLYPEFQMLELEQLLNLLGNDILTQEQNENSFKAIVRWIRHDTENREKHLCLLLSHIQTHFISQNFLETEILKDKLVRNNVAGMNWLLDSFSLTQSHRPNQLSRNSGIAVDLKDRNLFIMNENSCYEFHSFDIKSKLLNPLAERPKAQGFTAVSYKNSIYTVGGKRTRTALRYDIGSDTWHTIPFRCYLFAHSTCVINDCMYITGGYYESSWQNNVLRYDFNRGKMDLCARMMIKRGSHGSVAHRNCVYVCGGNYTGMTGSISLSLVERMDSREGMWRLLPRMLGEHGHCTAAIVSEKVYCSNSYGGLTERFDVRRCNWEMIAPAPGEYGSIVAFDDKLYRIFTDGIAVYSPENDVWETVANFFFELPIAVTMNV